MTATAQRQFGYTLIDPVRLVTAETARAVLGLSHTEGVAEQVDGGKIPFAFDLGRGGRRREVRIWVGCLVESVRYGDHERSIDLWNIDDVCAHALGTTEERIVAPEESEFRFTGSFLEGKWCISNVLVNDLVRSGDLRGHKVGKTTHVWRISAFNFLKARQIT